MPIRFGQWMPVLVLACLVQAPVPPTQAAGRSASRTSSRRGLLRVSAPAHLYLVGSSKVSAHNSSPLDEEGLDAFEELVAGMELEAGFSKVEADFLGDRYEALTKDRGSLVQVQGGLPSGPGAVGRTADGEPVLLAEKYDRLSLDLDDLPSEQHRAAADWMRWQDETLKQLGADPGQVARLAPSDFHHVPEAAWVRNADGFPVPAIRLKRVEAPARDVFEGDVNVPDEVFGGLEEFGSEVASGRAIGLGPATAEEILDDLIVRTDPDLAHVPPVRGIEVNAFVKLDHNSRVRQSFELGLVHEALESAVREAPNLSRALQYADAATHDSLQGWVAAQRLRTELASGYRITEGLELEKPLQRAAHQATGDVDDWLRRFIRDDLSERDVARGLLPPQVNPPGHVVDDLAQVVERVRIEATRAMSENNGLAGDFHRDVWDELSQKAAAIDAQLR